MVTLVRCDLFCRVIDNYGDIGVCWRLARQLANEHGLLVRLWIDDLNSFAKLCPEVDVTLEKQHRRGVEIRRWQTPFPDVQPADLVIEAFACQLPESYIAAMTRMNAQSDAKAVWVNLEYLSAEDWVQGCHGLPSPHPELALTKYFFFPGFTRQTGGLLLERDLLARRDAFQNDIAQQRMFWQTVGIDMPAAATLKVSLFSYTHVPLDGLLDVWMNSPQAVLCMVPEGLIVPQISRYFADSAPQAGNHYARGNLHVHILPFVEQEQYDLLLWACDINFVRGEDSCVRAQWAARPFIWQIYPQHDGAHWQKLQAFMDIYTARLAPSASRAVQALWQVLNGATKVEIAQAWANFIAVQVELKQHGNMWARQLAENNLALNLLDFYRKVGRIRASKNEE